jgi:Gluconate 2-dehydrogenase subunit 3
MRLNLADAPIILRNGVIAILDRAFLGLARVLTWGSWRRRTQLRRRQHERPQEPGRWFTPGEFTLVQGLAALVAPADDATPGAEEADVVRTIEAWVAASSEKQDLYARGLLGFEEVAYRRAGRAFCSLTEAERLELLKEVDRMNQGDEGPRSGLGRLIRRANRIYRAWRFPAAELFPRLSQDVLRAFYTSPVSWRWLSYDGPPMPAGYPTLLPRVPTVSGPEPGS